MTRYPVGFDPRPARVSARILEQDGSVRAESGGSGAAALEVVDWSVEAGANTSHGRATLVLDTSQEIPDGAEMQVGFARDGTFGDLWFGGHIEQSEDVYLYDGRRDLRVTAIGYGVRLAKRLATVQAYSEKGADGLTPQADAKMKVSALFAQLLTDPAVMTLEAVGAAFPGLDVSQVQDVPLYLADFQRTGQSAAILCNELAEIADAYWGVDPDKRAYLRLRGSEDSGFLVTHEPDSELARNWDQSKVLYAANREYRRVRSTVDGGYTLVHGLGAQYHELVHSPPGANAALDLSLKSNALPLSVRRDNLSKAAFRLRRTAVLQNPLQVSVVGAAAGGEPDPSDVRTETVVPAGRLNAELGAAYKWLEVPASSAKSHDETLYAVLGRYPEDGLRLSYRTAQGGYYESLDGAAWVRLAGSASARGYSAKTIHLVGQNTTTRKGRPETEVAYSLDDFPDQRTALTAFTGVLDSVGRTRVTFEPVECAFPGSRPPVGATARVVLPGVSTTATITGYSASGSAYGQSARGALKCAVHLEEWK